MKTFESFKEFWDSYFSDQKAPFDKWTITKFSHTTDDEYSQIRTKGEDNLGFQPTLITLADPIKLKTQSVVIKNLKTVDHDSLLRQYKARFIAQYDHRFGLFKPELKQADAVFDNWDSFYSEWLERDGQSLLSYNLPILFDHVSNIEYWGWKQKGFDPCGTQRLIITVFQYRTGRFAEVFIKNVNDTEMDRIKLLLKSRLTLQIEEIL